MLDREDGVKKRQAERDRDKIDWLEEWLEDQKNPIEWACARQCKNPGVLANVGILACSPM